jgi:hypothetical protein
MTVENLDSGPILALDSQPIVMQTAGEGAPGDLKSVSDFVLATASGVGSVGSTYRMCRIPTNAIIKSVIVDLGDLDSNASPTLVLDVNLAFSDSTYDGTNTNNQGLIPTTAYTGATTSIATYSSPNKAFGQISAAASGANKLSNELIFNGSMDNVAIGPWFPYGRELSVWEYFGFTDAQGYPADPGGFFDLLFYVSTGAATGHAGYIAAKVTYIK